MDNGRDSIGCALSEGPSMAVVKLSVSESSFGRDHLTSKPREVAGGALSTLFSFKTCSNMSGGI